MEGVDTLAIGDCSSLGIFSGPVRFGIGFREVVWGSIVTMDTEKKNDELSERITSTQASIHDIHQMRLLRDQMEGLIAAFQQLTVLL